MSDRIRVNVRSVANAKAARYEKRNGRDVVIVPSATLPDGVIMNGIQYPADEIEKSYMTLNRTPAPLGHPTINGQFLSAHDPEAQNMNGIGAWNENPRRENGKVYLDKVIDIARANSTDDGRRVLNAISAGGPIHTSTGLYCNIEEVQNGTEYTKIARNIEFDHDALLLDEEGAATPEQGVGVFVNSKGETSEISVINSRVEWADDQLEWAVEQLLDGTERLDNAKEPLLPRLVEALRGIMSGGSAETNETVQKEAPMDNETKEALEAVNAKVDALSDTIANAVAEAVKPIVEAQNAAREAQEAAAKAEHDALVNKAAEANIPGFGKETLANMDKPALEALISMHNAKRPAAPLAGGFMNNNGDDEDYSPLAGVKH